MLGLDQFVYQPGGTGEAHSALLPAGGYRQPGEEVSFTGPAQNRHILLSFQVQSSFTIGGIRCSARRCSPNDCIAVEAAREAWCVYCRITPGLWCRRG